MIDLLKALTFDLGTSNNRSKYIWAVISNCPGLFGMKIRQNWFRKNCQRIGENLRIHPGLTIIHPELLSCGNNVEIGYRSYIQAGGSVKLGNDVMLAPFVKIWSQNHKFIDPVVPIREQGYERMAVDIGNDVWLGANTFIMPGVILGDKCIVGACSVVGAKNYPPGTILSGNPARKIGERR